MARKSEFYKKERKTHPSFLGGWDIIAFFRYNSDFFVNVSQTRWKYLQKV